jgi:Mannosylglycerate hydrolase MGH1-like glycoside hydrolase domain/Glycosyl hydrolase family 63 C-terminal domain
MITTAEQQRIEADTARSVDWKRWGPYLSERQWATVREDYSEGGNCWDYFPHDHSRSRAYRWGEDGLLGLTDRQCRLCFALALWNGKDPILKERLFGLTGPEGNHGEDVKEQYFYLAATPTYSYAKALYKYPQAEFPYTWLVDENRRRGKLDPEFELVDTGIFNENRYFDVFAEFAKNSPNDILIRLSVANRGPDAATLHLLPNIWFRNDWSWGKIEEGSSFKPGIVLEKEGRLSLNQESLGRFFLEAGTDPKGQLPTTLFTENETNTRRLWGIGDAGAFVKDAFHEYLVHANSKAVNPANTGTKAALHYVLNIPAGATQTISLRLFSEKEASADPFGVSFEQTFATRVREAQEFYAAAIRTKLNDQERQVVLQATAGLLWSKQFYYYVVGDWLHGDPAGPTPPSNRLGGRNHSWSHLHSRDVISMPDKWEYPWFASWDLAFHVMPLSYVDPTYAKKQLVLFLREWYMHPNGQIPAYEFAFGDVNPPVHAWAAWRIYKISAARGARDREFLERVFQKLLLNFTWWVNRKDASGENLFSGGFLGLDNIGLFDRSQPLPDGDTLRQADGTAWMAFYCGTMLSMALELTKGDGTRTHQAYGDMASKFFEHFVQITDAMNHLGGTGLWDEEDGFYYDHLRTDQRVFPLKTRSLVGLLPLIAVEVLEQETIEKLPGFYRRFRWFMEHRPDLAKNISELATDSNRRLLAIATRERLERVLRYMLDENEFLSPHGLRSVSKFHEKNPSIFNAGGGEHRVDYEPAESSTGLFGGNSNWRGPIWFPINFLILEALERYDHFYGESLRVECPTGSGRTMNLRQVALELSRRLSSIFLPDVNGRRPCHGDDSRFATDPHWRDLVLFNEYFHGDTGRGLGASHQTGWTALAVGCIADAARERDAT